LIGRQDEAGLAHTNIDLLRKSYDIFGLLRAGSFHDSSPHDIGNSAPLNGRQSSSHQEQSETAD